MFFKNGKKENGKKGFFPINTSIQKMIQLNVNLGLCRI